MTPLGVALLVVGAVAVLVESHVPSLGVIGGPGVVALGVGAILAVAGLGGGLILSALAAVALVAISGATVGVSVRKGAAVQRRRVRAGPERLIGHVGSVRSWSEPAGGTVHVDGSIWQARRALGHEDEAPQEIHEGDSIVVERLHGLTLSVRPAEEWELMR
jgi:membrane-bound ClpP family serine protease